MRSPRATLIRLLGSRAHWAAVTGRFKVRQVKRWFIFRYQKRDRFPDPDLGGELALPGCSLTAYKLQSGLLRRLLSLRQIAQLRAT